MPETHNQVGENPARPLLLAVPGLNSGMTSNLTEAMQKLAALSTEDQDCFARYILDQLAVHAQAREQAAAAGGPAPGPDPRRHVRVLVVDDEEYLLEFTRKCLAKSGFQVLAANGGVAALEVLEGLPEPVDLLLVDCNMPDMSGPELIELVANRWPTVKFVLTSGFLTDANHARVEPYGVSILAKPYVQEDILREVYEKLGA